MQEPRKTRIKIKYDNAASIEARQRARKSGLAEATSHVVENTDTLWALANKYYGDPEEYTRIYDANASLIEESAKSHGRKTSGNGHWIYPGENLVIPANIQSLAAPEVANDDTVGGLMAAAATSFTYTDAASGSSDSVSVTLHNVSKLWLNELMPEKGEGFEASIVTTGWGNDQDFMCGAFTIDDMTFAGRPLTFTVSGVSIPTNDDFKSLPVTKVWKETSLQDIASQIAEQAGVQLVYEGKAIQIEKIEQSKQTNSAFLYNMCKKYGMAIKVYNNKIVIYEWAAYEAKPGVATLSEEKGIGIQILSWNYKTTIDGTYTGVTLSYTAPKKKKTVTVELGEAGRKYAMNVQASSEYDAELQAAAKVDEANRAIEKLTATIMGGGNGLVATQTVYVRGLGKADGKYFIDQIVHSVGSGYTKQLTMHKVKDPVLAH